MIGEILKKPVYGVIYCTTNTVNGMKYIGKRKLDQILPFRNYLGSGTALSHAIKKYGRGKFIKQVLCECYSLEEMNEMEMYYIGYYNAIKSNIFYNIAKGGDGGDLAYAKTFKTICQYDLNGKLVSKFNNARDAARALGDNYCNKMILRCCHGGNQKYKQFIFKFYDETKGKEIATYINTKGQHSCRQVSQYTLDGVFLKEYKSIVFAERALGIYNISAAILGKQKSAGGFLWEYSQTIKKSISHERIKN